MIFLARETLNELDITWEVAWRQLRPVVSAIVAMVTSVALIEIYMPADTVATRILRLFVVDFRWDRHLFELATLAKSAGRDRNVGSHPMGYRASAGVVSKELRGTWLLLR